jgi:two-component system sensor histidine kinase YesM
MSHIRKWFISRLSTKLIVMILLLLLVSIALISSLYYWSSGHIIANHVRASTIQSAEQSADYLSLILTVGTDVGQQIFRDTRIQEVIREEAEGAVSVDEKFDHKEIVDNILNNVMYSSSFVRSVYLLREEGNSWGSGLFNTSKVKRYTLNDHQWYTDVVQNQANDVWLPLHYDYFSGGGENNELVLTYVKPFRNLETRKAIGAILVNIDGQLILQAIERIRLGTTGRFLVIDEEGTLMIGSNREEWGRSIQATPLGQKVMSLQTVEGEFELDVDGVATYVVARKMDNGWTIVGTVPIHEVIGDIQRLQKQIWLYSALFMLLASLTGFLFSRKITSPLKQLMVQMGEIEKSNFQAMTEVTSQDEIGQLSRRFNRMVRQIETLIEQVNVSEARKREAEMRALRYQINPHFLYNTLSSIRWMVKLHKYDGAYNGISALVRLMEASMEKKGVYCSIQDELELLQKYMIIQQFRYGDHIRLHIDCDPSLYDKTIPRMLLQPIVENAIFHGIAPKESGGRVDVTVRCIPRGALNVLIFSIQDDGLGIPQDKIKDLLTLSKDSKSSGMFGIGLHHVQETIQLYYGLQSGVYIESSEGCGTCIRLELSVKAGEEYAV